MDRFQRAVDLFELTHWNGGKPSKPARILTTFDLRNAYVEDINERQPGALPFAVEDARQHGQFGIEIAFNGLPVCPDADLPADTVIVE